MQLPGTPNFSPEPGIQWAGRHAPCNTSSSFPSHLGRAVCAIAGHLALPVVYELVQRVCIGHAIALQVGQLQCRAGLHDVAAAGVAARAAHLEALRDVDGFRWRRVQQRGRRERAGCQRRASACGRGRHVSVCGG